MLDARPENIPEKLPNRFTSKLVWEAMTLTDKGPTRFELITSSQPIEGGLAHDSPSKSVEKL
jgi:hypothetical protein